MLSEKMYKEGALRTAQWRVKPSRIKVHCSGSSSPTQRRGCLYCLFSRGWVGAHPEELKVGAC